MARRANPVLIGGFVVGAVALAVTGLVLLGGAQLFREKRVMVAYFEGSVKGVSIGAPVTFQGAKVGTVTDVRVVVDFDKHTIVTPVFFGIDKSRLTGVSGNKITLNDDGGERMKRLFDQGLRAELEIQSFVTGQVGIALEFHPEKPKRLTGLSDGYLEVPTIPSDIEKLTQTIQNLPVGELMAAAKETIETVRDILQSPQTQATLRSLQNASRRAEETLAAAEGLVRRVDAKIDPLMVEIKDTAKSARGALNEAQATLARLTPTVETTLKDYQTLARNADQRLGQLTVSADRTLTSVDRTLRGADEVLGDGSAVRANLETALDELSEAAQSIRVLADYLERNPNSLVFGKGRPR